MLHYRPDRARMLHPGVQPPIVSAGNRLIRGSADPRKLRTLHAIVDTRRVKRASTPVEMATRGAQKFRDQSPRGCRAEGAWWRLKETVPETGCRVPVANNPRRQSREVAELREDLRHPAGYRLPRVVAQGLATPCPFSSTAVAKPRHDDLTAPQMAGLDICGLTSRPGHQSDGNCPRAADRRPRPKFPRGNFGLESLRAASILDAASWVQEFASDASKTAAASPIVRSDVGMPPASS